MAENDTPSQPQRLLLVDDDAVSREVLSLLATNAGYTVPTAESGNDALTLLRAGLVVDIVLTDLQMPGICGDALAPLLRAACPAGAVILAMSASGTAAPAYDGFLRKPFPIAALTDLLAGHATIALPPASAPVLDETVFRNLAAAMGHTQRHALYTMCLDDADRRIDRMRKAAEARDHATFVREAHALRGGCGMVGATELRQLASLMEENGLPPNFDPVNISGSLDRLLAASDRLRGILNTHPEETTKDAPTP